MDKHKKRLKEYFLNEDTSFISDRRLLSGILSFSDTVKAPEALADVLLKKYQHMDNIMGLTTSELINDADIDEDTTFLIRLIIEVSARRLVQSGIGRVISSPAEACEFFNETYKGMNVEELRIVCLNSDLKVIDYAIIARGDQKIVTFNKDELLRKVVNSGCKLCIIAHNHPGAPSTPSDADFRVTNKLCKYLDELGITLIEHVIIGEDGAKSMLSENMISRML